MPYINWYGLAFTAARSVMMHKLRSFLTILGLIFGVASVIVMLAVAEGASQTVQSQIASLGVNNIIVRSVKPPGDQPASVRTFLMKYGITYEDLRRMESTLDGVRRFMPLREYIHEARYEAHSHEARVVGVTPSYFDVNHLSLATGRSLEAVDLVQCANVCVIGESLAQKLFPSESALDKSVQVGRRHFFRVVGVLR